MTSIRRHRQIFSTAGLLLSLSMCLFVLSCSDSTPIKIGFVAGISGQVSDLGGPARNGMLLAVEETNQQGGVNGRHLEVLIKDDKQDAKIAQKAVTELINEDVDVILGPVTSSMAVSVVGLANAAEKLLVGITVTTNELSKKDDYFIRGISSNSSHAVKMAEYLYETKGLKRFSGVYDRANINFSRDWLNTFSRHFESLGGYAINKLDFTSGNPEQLIGLAAQLLEGDPDVVVLVTNAVDAALISKLIREQNKSIQIAMSAWSGTERLIELGGRHVEGAILPLYYDLNSQDQDYLTFKQNYLQRFKSTPDYSSIVAYNVTNFVLAAMEVKEKDQHLKHAMIEMKEFPAIQGAIRIDQYGDAKGNDIITRVQHGIFKTQGR